MIKHRTILLTLLLLLPCGQTPAEEAPARSLGPDRKEFVIGVEDVLRIVVWGEQDLTMNAKVRPDGKITMPLVNDVEVVGLTPIQVRDKITRQLSRFVRDPNVTVIVEEINSFRIYYLGEVTVQGALQFYRPTRILQAIAAAGGTTEFSKNEIVLLREESGVEKRILIDYKRLLSGDPAQENIFVRPGDTLLFK